jgi:alpha-D-ribose 1-methylphosphonate 5-triphosphate diphosphatase
MMTETVLDNARIVLRDGIVEGHAVIRDGVVAETDKSAAGKGEDFGGDYLTPGLVELHTDHLEGHFMPRPRVRWNMMAAIQAHDAQLAASGVTTVFDALRVGVDEADISAAETKEMADAIAFAGDNGRLRADHFIHLRCEVSAPDVLDGFDLLAGSARVRLASLMDHAPGQRQFASLESYRIYYQGKMKLSDAEFERFCDRRIRQSQQYSGRHRPLLAGRCREAGITLASHDDATAAHVAEAVALGTSLAEFPTTAEAAAASRKAGLSVLMGAPNIVRGGSHSGNISALDLYRAGHLDVLSSDYVPFSLLQAAFALAESGEASLPAALRLVTANPARAAGLDDRGEIAPGKRADLVRVSAMPGMPPVVRAVWRGGERVV